MCRRDSPQTGFEFMARRPMESRTAMIKELARLN
jgi:hypothetical protein